jgi:2-oxo-4-hydroxy-4-carboxy--5-ureidoimidazoline (OHCU) decarboxylase
MSEAPAIPPIERLDELGADAIVGALAPLFEGAPAFVARLARDGPFGSDAALLDQARVIVLTMPESEQIELLDGHPRIGAPPATVSAQSFREQGYDRDPAPDGALDNADEEAARQQLATDLERLNAAYETRFGFRFVIHVGGRSRAEIARLMERHLVADREEEKRRALVDVVDIAGERLLRLRGMGEAT